MTGQYSNLQMLYIALGEKRLSFIQTTVNDVSENKNMYPEEKLPRFYN